MMKRFAVAFGVLLLCAGQGYTADTPPKRPQRIPAAVESMAGPVLKAKTASGTEITVTLADDVKVSQRQSSSLDALGTKSFVGCTAVEKSGKLIAQEIHIFPEALRGTGEGHYPWGDQADTTMTNGNVETLEGVSTGKEINVSYKGGTSKIEIPPTVTVTKIVLVGKDTLKPGTQVLIFASPDPKGDLLTHYIGLQAVAR
jgi:hypothetical protein